jgi:hypothetical protein
MTTAAGRSSSLIPVPFELPLYPPTIFFIRADNYASGEENEAAKAKNPRVLIEQNSVSGKIVNVRENANLVPHCKIEIIERVMYFSLKAGHFDRKWRLF